MHNVKCFAMHACHVVTFYCKVFQDAESYGTGTMEKRRSGKKKILKKELGTLASVPYIRMLHGASCLAIKDTLVG